MIPAVGSVPLRELSGDGFNALYRRCREHLSAQSVLHIHRILYGALAYGVKHGYVGVNAAAAADPPRPEHREMAILDAQGIHNMVDAVQGSQWHSVFFLALYTGLRRSELLGLKWKDVDRSSAELHIERGLHQLADGTLETQAPKTTAGRRTVAIGPDAAIALRGHREQAEADAEILDREIAADSYIFTSADGGPMKPHSVSQAWRRTARRLGYNVRFHDARHTHASLLLAQGVTWTISKS